jgi:hypothetical protein
MTKKQEGTEVVVAPPSAVALPEDVLARLGKYAQATAKAEIVRGQFFGTRSGILSFNKQPLKDNTMEVVVLASMFENVYYPEAFNPSAIESPLCFAFSPDGVDMEPHAEATDQQAGSCGDCIHSKWTTDPKDNKRRKACKETRRLSCIPADATLDAGKIANATAGYLRVPVTSVKFWSAYAQRLAAGGIPPFAAVTRITLRPDQATQVRFDFEPVRTITDPDVLAELFKRHDAEYDAMSFPYEKRAPKAPGAAAPATEAPPPPGSGKF